MAPGPKTATAAVNSGLRVSNGLKEFLWLLNDTQRGKLLDLGQVSQQTLNFFIERSFRVSTEDFLRSWREFMNVEDEKRQRAAASHGYNAGFNGANGNGANGNGANGNGNGHDVDDEMELPSAAALASKFLETILQYPPESFHGVLAWDLFDYMDSELLNRVVPKLYELLRPGGLILAMFHSKPPDRYCRYRITQSTSFELLPTAPLAPHVRVFQNRQIMETFGKFRSSKTFVGRDQVREALFIK